MRDEDRQLLREITNRRQRELGIVEPGGPVHITEPLRELLVKYGISDEGDTE